MTTEKFILMCREVGLTTEDEEEMTVGMILNYIDEYYEMKNPNKKPKVRSASQADFDNF